MTSACRTSVLIAAITWVVLATAAPSAAQTTGAQPPPGSPEFSKLVEGRNIVVRMVDGESREDRVERVTQTEIVFRELRSVPFDQIWTVSRSSYRIRYATLIGLGAGVAAGIAAAPCDTCAPLAIVTGGLGAGIGAIVGAILNEVYKKRDIIYQRRSTTISFAIAPILAHKHKGVAFGMSWR
jgi:hypothetical protein